MMVDMWEVYNQNGRLKLFYSDGFSFPHEAESNVT